MPTLRRWSLALAVVLWPAMANGQQCSDSADGSSQQRSRREAGTRFIQSVNEQQARMYQDRGTYVSLSESGAPTAPVGFVPRLVFDRWGYLIVVKDLFDVCGFALISDEHGVVYEGRPTVSSRPTPPRQESSADSEANDAAPEDRDD
jgi:hypothetical protein